MGSTLEELHLDIQSWHYRSDEIRHVIRHILPHCMPALTSLHIHFLNPRDGFSLARSLPFHRTLQQLTVDLMNTPDDDAFATEIALANAFRENLRHNGSLLHTQLFGRRLVPDIHGMHTQAQWCCQRNRELPTLLRRRHGSPQKSTTSISDRMDRSASASRLRLG